MHMPTGSTYFSGIMLCLLATLSWGAMFPVMGSALHYIDPFMFTLLRYSLAGAAFLWLLVHREGWTALRISGQQAGMAWLFGTAGFAGFGFLVFWGQQMAGHEGALTASIIMATQPMLGLLVNWLLRKVVPRRASILFILLSFCGVALVISKGQFGAFGSATASLAADGLIVLGALCWVTYTVGAAFFPGWSPLKYTTLTTGLGLISIGVIDAYLVAGGDVAVPDKQVLWQVFPHLLYMAFVAGVVGVLSWNIGNRTLGAQNGVLFMDVIPVTTFAISAAQGVVPQKAQLIGACMTCLALLSNNLYLRLQQRRDRDAVAR